MDKKEPKTIELYKKWLTGRLCEYVKKIELAAGAGDGITKDFIYKSDIIDILNGREYEAFEPPLKEHDIVNKYFDSINIEYKKDKHHAIKCFNILGSKTTVSHNFYEIIIFPFEKSLLVLGHINGQPYEYRYYYRDLYHLERIIKETFIQNCLYAKYDKQPILKLKGDMKDESEQG